MRENRALVTVFIKPNDVILGECAPYSGQACIDAAETLGLTSGSRVKGESFADEDHVLKGCYAYSSGTYKGTYWYGTGGSLAEIKDTLEGGERLRYYRPKGFDCEKSKSLQLLHSKPKEPL